jgi:hypothetical protein
MYRLIENIKSEAKSNRWANKKGAQFQYDVENNQYRLIELTPDLETYIIGRFHRNDTNCPVIVKGFVAYLIRNWGKSEQQIFDNYYENSLNNFKRIELRKPGSSMRNLDAEFYPLHVSQEKEFVTFSKQIKSYLSEPEIKLINKYFESYFKYIKQKYLALPASQEQLEEQKPELNETELSEKIKKHFAFFLGNCPRRGKPILRSENDFNKLIEWTAYFYENNFEVPDIVTPIQTVNTNDYITQLAFLYLFDQLRKFGFHNQRTRAKTIFTLWEKSFADYKGYSEKNFWKVKHENGEEVKKLMQIDY